MLQKSKENKILDFDSSYFETRDGLFLSIVYDQQQNGVHFELQNTNSQIFMKNTLVQAQIEKITRSQWYSPKDFYLIVREAFSKPQNDLKCTLSPQGVIEINYQVSGRGKGQITLNWVVKLEQQQICEKEQIQLLNRQIQRFEKVIQQQTGQIQILEKEILSRNLPQSKIPIFENNLQNIFNYREQVLMKISGNKSWQGIKLKDPVTLESNYYIKFYIIASDHFPKPYIKFGFTNNQNLTYYYDKQNVICYYLYDGTLISNAASCPFQNNFYTKDTQVGVMLNVQKCQMILIMNEQPLGPPISMSQQFIDGQPLYFFVDMYYQADQIKFIE